MSDIPADLGAIVGSAQDAFAQAVTPADLENAKARFLGKAGQITELMKGMAALSVDEKKTRGAAINQAKQAIEAALNARRQALADAELAAQLKADALDVTLPGRVRGKVVRVNLEQAKIDFVLVKAPEPFLAENQAGHDRPPKLRDLDKKMKKLEAQKPRKDRKYK